MQVQTTTWTPPATYVPGFHDLEVIKKMEYRSVPHFGLVSVLGFGGSSLGGMHTAGEGTGLVGGGKDEGDEIWWVEDHREDIKRATELLTMYLKSGGNVIDTSHWYGQGKSERLIGHALRNVPRKAYYLMTKVCRYDKDLMKMFDFSYARTYQSTKDSLKRLQVDYVDVMQVHDPEFAPSLEIVVNEAFRALNDAKKNGLTRFVGVTGYPIETQEKIIKRCFEVGVVIHTSLTYCRYTLNDRSLLESSYWETCEKYGIAVINASPISMGLLMHSDPPAWHPATNRCKILCKKAATYCASQSVDLTKLAIHFVLREPRIATTLSSTSCPEQFARNLSLAHTPLTSHEEGVLQYIMKEFFLPAGNLSWEGVELAAYWEEVGKKLIMEKKYSKL